MSVYVAKDLQDALSFRRDNDCIIMAGGSDLMVSAYRGAGVLPHFEKDILLIRNLKELNYIKKTKKGVVIGACTVSRQIASSTIVPWVLRQAAGNMGAIGLRNSATIAGNIANASPKGDTPGPLYLLDAVVTVESLNNGKRDIPIRDFIVKFRTIDLREDEIITSITVPFTDDDMTYWFYHKIGTRRANAISKLTLSCAAKITKGVVDDFRISATACGAVTNRSDDVENICKNLTLSQLVEKKEDISSAFDKVISPRAMPEFRREACKRMIEDFILKISKRPRKKFFD